jgi:hypothetical protein
LMGELALSENQAARIEKIAHTQPGRGGWLGDPGPFPRQADPQALSVLTVAQRWEVRQFAPERRPPGPGGFGGPPPGGFRFPDAVDGLGRGVRRHSVEGLDLPVAHRLGGGFSGVGEPWNCAAPVPGE